MPQPMGVRKDELFSDEDWANTSVSDEDDDWSDTSVSGHVDVPMLAFKTDVISRTVGVSGLSLPVCNLQFRSGASNMTLSREGMMWLCLLSSADARTGDNGAMSMELGGQGLDH